MLLSVPMASPVTGKVQCVCEQKGAPVPLELRVVGHMAPFLGDALAFLGEALAHPRQDLGVNVPA
jgi:hypothetical protein